MPPRDSLLGDKLWNYLEFPGEKERCFRSKIEYYKKQETVCMECWLFNEKTSSFLGAENEEPRTEPDFSPFLIHSAGNGPSQPPMTWKGRSERSGFGNTDLKEAIEQMCRCHNGSLVDYF